MHNIVFYFVEKTIIMDACVIESGLEVLFCLAGQAGAYRERRAMHL